MENRWVKLLLETFSLSPLGNGAEVIGKLILGESLSKSEVAKVVAMVDSCPIDTLSDTLEKQEMYDFLENLSA